MHTHIWGGGKLKLRKLCDKLTENLVQKKIDTESRSKKKLTENQLRGRKSLGRRVEKDIRELTGSLQRKANGDEEMGGTNSAANPNSS